MSDLDSIRSVLTTTGELTESELLTVARAAEPHRLGVLGPTCGLFAQGLSDVIADWADRIDEGWHLPERRARQRLRLIAGVASRNGQLNEAVEFLLASAATEDTDEPALQVLQSALDADADTVRPVAIDRLTDLLGHSATRSLVGLALDLRDGRPGHPLDEQVLALLDEAGREDRLIDGVRNAIFRPDAFRPITSRAIARMLDRGLLQSFMERWAVFPVDPFLAGRDADECHERLRVLIALLDDPVARSTALQHGDPTELRIGLGAMLMIDSAEAESIALAVLDEQHVGRVAATAGLLAHTAVPSVAAQVLRHRNPVARAAALTVMTGIAFGPTPSELAHPLLTILREMDGEPIRIDVPGWSELRVEPKAVARLAVRARETRAEDLIPAARVVDAQVRVEWVEHLRLPYNEAEVDYLVELCVGRAADPRAAATNALRPVVLSDVQIDVLAGALTSKSSDLRRSVLEVLSEQSEDARRRAAMTLHAGSDHQRAAAVELDRQLDHGADVSADQPVHSDDLATEPEQVQEPAPFVSDSSSGYERRLVPVIDRAPTPEIPEGWPHDATSWLPTLLEEIDRDLTALDDLELRVSRGDRHIEVKVGLDPSWSAWLRLTADEQRVKATVSEALEEAAERLRLSDGVDSFVSALAGYCSLPMPGGFLLPHRESGGGLEAQWCEQYRSLCHPELAAVGELSHPRLLRSLVSEYFSNLTGADVDLALSRGLCSFVATFAADDADVARQLRHRGALGWMVHQSPFGKVGAARRNAGPVGYESAALALAAHQWVDRPHVGAWRAPLDDVVVLDAVHHGLLTVDDVVDWIGSMTTRYSTTRLLGSMTTRTRERPSDLPATLATAADVVRDAVVASECTRGDLPTGWTRVVPLLSAVEGVQTLVDLVAALGDRPLWRSARAEDHREATISRLLQISYPLPTDGPTDLSSAARDKGIGHDRLLELAMFAPQWAGLVETVVRKAGLEDAVWWWHAHNKDNKWHVPQELRDAWADGIAQWSVAAPARSTMGGTDEEWFRRARRRLGAETWARLERLSNLTSPASGHRRAVNSSVALLATDPDPYIASIDRKRDGEAMRCLGLVPLPRARRARLDELLRRRAVLLNVQKTQRKPTSAKSESENEAIAHAMDSLAWSAGLVDVSRLNWMLEAESARVLTDGSLRVRSGSTTVSLEVDQEGNVVVAVSKAGKSLKSVPASMRGLAEVAEIRARHRELKSMTARVRRSLENSMVVQERFGRADLEQILEHPVLEPVAALLVLVDADGETGVRASGGSYRDVHDDEWRPKWPVRVAHPVDLVQAGVWPTWQRHVVEQSIRQPFKQVFRELYVPTIDELASDASPTSERYSGHRVELARAMALLRSRGWSVDRRGAATRSLPGVPWSASVVIRDELYGFGQRGEISAVSWFSPDHRDAGLAEVPSVVFSETMRDLDLVVSVAHSTGSTPNSSGASVQMRQSLVREVARLFDIDVTFDRRWAEVVGTLGMYRVHLGSGSVVSSGGTSIHLEVDARAGRGLVFLPFLDDDPISTSVVTKVVTLGRDSEIRDAELRSTLERA